MQKLSNFVTIGETAEFIIQSELFCTFSTIRFVLAAVNIYCCTNGHRQGFYSYFLYCLFALQSSAL